MEENPRSSRERGPSRPGSPIGLDFILFAACILFLLTLAIVESFLQSSLWPADAASRFGAVAATVYGLSGLVGGARVYRTGRRVAALIAVVQLAAAVWCWLILVDVRTDPLFTSVLSVAGAVVAIVLLRRGLRFAHWLDVFSGLGMTALVLATTLVATSPETAGQSVALALMVGVGGMAGLYGGLVDVDLTEKRALYELVESRRLIQEEVHRAEEVLHDLRNGLLAIEAAIGNFDGELAAPLRLEAARLRQLTVRGSRRPTVFDLVARVDDLVRARKAGGLVVDLQAPPVAPVWGEESEVLAIVDNLLANAERHGRSGSILVEISNTDLTTSLAVSNDGPNLGSIDPDLMFERGVTTHPDGEGIGLSRARLLATMNGADLALRPSDDGRTTFVLDLEVGPPPDLDLTDLPQPVG